MRECSIVSAPAFQAQINLVGTWPDFAMVEDVGVTILN